MRLELQTSMFVIGLVGRLDRIDLKSFPHQCPTGINFCFQVRREKHRWSVTREVATVASRCMRFNTAATSSPLFIAVCVGLRYEILQRTLSLETASSLSLFSFQR